MKNFVKGASGADNCKDASTSSNLTNQRQEDHHTVNAIPDMHNSRITSDIWHNIPPSCGAFTGNGRPIDIDKLGWS